MIHLIDVHLLTNKLIAQLVGSLVLQMIKLGLVVGKEFTFSKA